MGHGYYELFLVYKIILNKKYEKDKLKD